jgi:hypothetical protein
LFGEAGYDPIAPGWPGEASTVDDARVQPEAVANVGIDDATDHFAKIIAALPANPVIIGHSFGGLIAEKLLGEGIGAAAVAIDPAQIKGVLPLPLAQLRAGLPALGNPTNLNKAVSLTRKEFRFGLWQRAAGGRVGRAVRQVDHPVPGQTAVPGGGQLRPALPGEGRHRQRHQGATLADFWHVGPHRARCGHPVDVEAVPGLHGSHRTQAVRRPWPVTDIDSGWKDVADAALAWLKTKGLKTSGT